MTGIRRGGRWGLGCLVLLGTAFGTRAGQPDRVDFQRDVQPILTAQCVDCHGPKKQRGSLRLDGQAAALRGGDSGPAISAGKSAVSLLVERITSNDPTTRMPLKKPALTPQQVGILKRWIDQGADWPGSGDAASRHWSFQPIKNPVPPKTDDWGNNPIDAFVLARLKAAGLKPSPAADRRTLIRRLYLDMLGLPPTPEEIDAFLADRGPDAYERLVDRVLASPHHGERWARHWLDLARFAETHGFERNLERPGAWPYRDYVVRALNEDRPYNRFVREQLVGDAMGEDAATGFLVAGPFDDVKSNEAKFRRLQRQDELADMVNATGTAFLGLTLGCARCHTHKFDPITHKDYHALTAVLAGVQHGERPLKTAEVLKAGRALEETNKRIVQLETALAPHRRRLREPVSLVKNTETFAPVKARFVRFTVEATRDGDEPALDELEVWSAGPSDAEAMKMFARKAFEVAAPPRLAVLTVTCDDHCVVWLNGKRVAATDDWQKPAQVDVKGELRRGRNVLAVACRDDKKPAGLLLRLVVESADGGRQSIVTDPTWRQSTQAPQGWEKTTFDDATWENAVSHGVLGVAPWGSVFARGAEPAPQWIWTAQARNLALASGGAKVTASGSLNDNPLRHKLEFIHDGKPGDASAWVSDQAGKGWVQVELPRPAVVHRVVWGRDRTMNYDDRLPVRYRVEVAEQPGKWRTVASSSDRLPLDVEKDERLRYDPSLLDGKARRIVEEQITELAALRGRRERLQRTPTSIYAGTFAAPGVVRRLARGDPEQPRETIDPDTVSILGALSLPKDAAEQKRRDALARWITDAKNPLTARVMVNRIWQHHFGTGLVATPSDFGTQGEKPSHPALLDWLARRLVEDGWSLKHVHRLILTSSTYRQASWPNAAAAKVDAGSRLLWRFPPRRLEAEPLRDGVLAVSGVLDRRMGGPGFSPFKPTRHHVRVYEPKEKTGPEDWRRAVYMTKVRMEHDAVFGVFDAPDGGLVCPKRSRSTTALQAFNLLHSEFVVQQSGLFAKRVRREAGAKPADQVQRAFLLALGRKPDEEEAAVGAKLIAAHGLQPLCLALFNANEFVFIP